ncbi:MAG TPA: hypothetical protein PKK26_17135 [Candidatus Wallbacteria bacterium]|nr:hypothetical protein [Candidatus Wallbacteria bacterium]
MGRDINEEKFAEADFRKEMLRLINRNFAVISGKLDAPKNE